jgi:hypothetical protein
MKQTQTKKTRYLNHCLRIIIIKTTIIIITIHWKLPEIIQTIPDQHNGKARHQGTTQSSHTGHSSHTAGSADVKVQNV